MEEQVNFLKLGDFSLNTMYVSVISLIRDTLVYFFSFPFLKTKYQPQNTEWWELSGHFFLHSLMKRFWIFMGQTLWWTPGIQRWWRELNYSIPSSWAHILSTSFLLSLPIEKQAEENKSTCCNHAYVRQKNRNKWDEKENGGIPINDSGS